MFYFFDDEHVSAMRGLTRVPGPVEKLGPILEPVEGEGTSIGSFASSIVRLDDGRYRMYYTAHSFGTAWQMGIGVGESCEGRRWERRPLGQVTREGRDTSLLHIDGLPTEQCQSFHGQPQVVRLSDGRWRMFFWAHGGYARYAVAHSEDGLHWVVDDFDRPAIYHPNDPGAWGWEGGEGLTPSTRGSRKALPDLSPAEWLRRKRLQSNDATYVYYNEDTRLFEMYSVWLIPNPEGSPRRVAYDNAPGVLRTIHRRISEDGLEWREPELVLVPDDLDPLDLQFYFLAVHRQEGWRIGMLGYYPVVDQTMDIELCFSRDGRQWLRPIRGAWLPRGPEEHDSLTVYAPNCLLDEGDNWLLLYTGCNGLHNAPCHGDTTYRTIVCGAVFPKHRFLGLRAGGANSGYLLTRPFLPAGPELWIDAEVRGSIRAEICDPFGVPVPRFHKTRFQTLKGDSTHHVLRWEDADTAPLQFEPVSLRLEVERATVYGIGWQSSDVKA